MSDGGQAPLTPARTDEWLATFLTHFDLLRTTSIGNELDYLARTNSFLSLEGIQQEKSLAPGSTIDSREQTPNLRKSTSRESTPVFASDRSRETTPMLSLDMDDPVQAATALTWLETAVLEVDAEVEAEDFRELIAIPLAKKPDMEREVLCAQAGAVNERLAVAAREVLGRVEWGGDGEVGNVE
ncbi:hypothetical protein Q7P37_001428 [Cladosporium fusiforme]